jgi:hypothetical protein
MKLKPDVNVMKMNVRLDVNERKRLPLLLHLLPLLLLLMSLIRVMMTHLRVLQALQVRHGIRAQAVRITVPVIQALLIPVSVVAILVAVELPAIGEIKLGRVAKAARPFFCWRY